MEINEHIYFKKANECRYHTAYMVGFFTVKKSTPLVGKHYRKTSQVEFGWRTRGLRRFGDHMFFIVRAQLSS